MRHRKNFKSNLSEAGAEMELKIDSATTSAAPCITFPDNSTGQRNFDSKKFLGKGFDEIVLTSFNTIQRLLSSAIDTDQQTRSYTTIASYCIGGLNHLFDCCDYLIKSKHYSSLNCEDITADFILGFLDFLEMKPIKTQRHIFTRVKAILTEREFNISSSWFPTTNFAKKDQNEPPRATCFTPNEHVPLLKALSSEVRNILKGTLALTPEQLSYCLITIADKTGANLQPLLEIDITSVTDHPFHPQKRILILYKRRGNKSQPIPLIPDENEGEPNFAETTPFIEKILKAVISRNNAVRQSSSYPSRIFVASDSANGGVSGKALTKTAIKEAVKKLVRNHELKSIDGKSLVVNFERLRKTWENNVYKLNNYDPYATAALANHSVKVSNDHYLQAPPDSKKKHHAMVEVRVRDLLNYTCEPTVIASCTDLKNGDRAPKNGSLCVQVFGCFNCSNFVVTADDLYRLTSFYFYCLRQRKTTSARTWKKTYSAILRTITNDILPKFEKKLVEATVTKARTTPHPAWK